jgi:hypothetical protein
MAQRTGVCPLKVIFSFSDAGFLGLKYHCALSPLKNSTHVPVSLAMLSEVLSCGDEGMKAQGAAGE